MSATSPESVKALRDLFAADRGRDGGGARARFFDDE